MYVKPPKGFDQWDIIERVKRAATYRRSGVHFDCLGFPPAPPSPIKESAKQEESEEENTR